MTCVESLLEKLALLSAGLFKLDPEGDAETTVKYRMVETVPQKSKSNKIDEIEGFLSSVNPVLTEEGSLWQKERKKR